ncbi:hypothetical protein C8A00DRAFT_32397 [Chaetomidium leptoderma]|uniref:Actin-like ATPase domain-containing protein n=1 Tax=Chaetomidium leptoderma TaxID=669021 RepID=A0AAN6VNE2_9PEZI|nr:hypothetical protein C8A00DRAFT_32397 [Chaetomidium leptoderma]
MAAQPSGVVIVAIDFGTTYSGIAFARPGDLVPKALHTWPSRSSHVSAKYSKVPTALSISPDNDTQWGYGVSSENEPFVLFKLLLVRQDLLPQTVQTSPLFRDIQKKSALVGMTGRALASAYLGKLWQHFLSDARFNEQERNEMQLAITIPAGWPESVQADMTAALREAGILASTPGGCNVRFFWEPQAAAHAMILDLNQECGFEADDMAIVCDCGGATVDCITYKIESVSPLQTREVVGSAGRLYGVAFIRAGFILLLKEKMAATRPPGALTVAITDAELEAFAEIQWDQKIFHPFSGDELYFPVDIPAHWDGESRTLRFYKADIVNLMASAVRDVCDLVMAQHQAVSEMTKHAQSPKYVLLCGGFSGNPYLRDALQKRIPGPTKVQWYEDHDYGRLHLACEITLSTDVQGIELEVLAISHAGTGVDGIEFAVRRNGALLGRESARVGYYAPLAVEEPTT